MQNTPKGPFPFKGKGEIDWRIKSLRERSEFLRSELKTVINTMRSLIDNYDATFEGKLATYLVFHCTANGTYIRWRMNGTKQRYFAIANDEIGESFLNTQSAPVKKVLLGFEQHRLRLNLLHGLYFYESRSIEKLIASMRRVSALAR